VALDLFQARASGRRAACRWLAVPGLALQELIDLGLPVRARLDSLQQGVLDRVARPSGLDRLVLEVFQRALVRLDLRRPVLGSYRFSHLMKMLARCIE